MLHIRISAVGDKVQTTSGELLMRQFRKIPTWVDRIITNNKIEETCVYSLRLQTQAAIKVPGPAPYIVPA